MRPEQLKALADKMTEQFVKRITANAEFKKSGKKERRRHARHT